MCIYCGTKKLSSGISRFGHEHIIPLALGGSLILREASCTACARIINKEIETPVLLKEWGYFRTKRGLPSRSKRKGAKRKASKTHVVMMRRDGRPMNMPLANYSTPVPLYKFKEARIFSGQPRGDDNFQWTMEILTSHEEEVAMQEKFPEWDRTHRILALPHPFARMLAKIAYSYTVAEYGLAGFTPLGLDIILGRSDDYFYTVGGNLEIQPAIPGGDHITNIEILFRSAKRAIISVEIRLFSQITTPTYRVAVGEIDFDNPHHFAIFAKHRLDGKIPNVMHAIG
jgi:hypothetical protein